MSKEILELSRRKALAAAAAVGIAGAGAGLGTSALFGDEESFANNAIRAGTTNLTVQARIVARSAALDGDPSSPPGVSIQETVVDGSPGVGLTFTDLKPGDKFVLGLDVTVEGNPMYVRLEAQNADDGEGVDTEPEQSARGAGTDSDQGNDAIGDGDDAGDLDNETLVTIGHDATDGTANDFTWDTGGLTEPSDPEFDSAGGLSLTSFLTDLQDGVLYRNSSNAPLGHGSDTLAEIGGGDNVTHWLYLRVPTDTGNQIQGDRLSFDLVWSAEQVRNNSANRETLQLNQTVKLLSTDPTGDAYFGADTAVDGDTIVVSADGRDLDGENSGAAYAFDYDGQQWNTTGPLRPGTGVTEAGDLFGEAVAVDEDTVVVGAPGDDENGSNAGAAYVFGRDAGSWTRDQRLSPTDASAGDSFGQDVAVGSGLVAVGADGESSRATEAGAVYLFEYDGSGWSQAARLAPAGLSAEDYFGARVAVAEDGETVVVGAYGDDEAGEQAGAAYVFERSGGWSQETKLLPQAGSADGLFGSSVAIDRDTVLVGAFGTPRDGAEYAGAAYAFTRENGSFGSPARLEPPTPSRGEFFGWEVSLHDGVAVVGAYGNGASGDEAGAAYIFSRSGGDWTEQTELRSTDIAAGDRFGVSVATDGTATVVTADGDGVAGENTGAAYVFREGDS